MYLLASRRYLAFSLLCVDRRIAPGSSVSFLSARFSLAPTLLKAAELHQNLSVIYTLASPAFSILSNVIRKLITLLRLRNKNEAAHVLLVLLSVARQFPQLPGRVALRLQNRYTVFT